MTRTRTLNLLRTTRDLDPQVATTERITVPVGTIVAWRVEAVGADGKRMTIWIDKTTCLSPRGDEAQTEG